MSMAVSPDKRYVVRSMLATAPSSRGICSLWRCSTRRPGRWRIFPTIARWRALKADALLRLAFSRDGRRLYASMGSLTDPEGKEKNDTGSGILVYRFTAGKIAPERFIHLPLQQLAAGRKTKLVGDRDGDNGVPFPAAIAVVGAAGAEKLLVAENSPTMCC